MSRLPLRIPLSFGWFAATAVIFVLQWIPITGVFLMLLAAPLWSVLTVNAGFVSLAIEAATGRTSRLWLIAPIAWFGGYAIAAQLSERAFERLDAQIRAGNAQSRLPFDPTRSVVVVKENADDLGSAAQRLVQDYRLAVAYTERGSKQSRRQTTELPQLDPTYRAHRIARSDTCVRLRNDARLREAHAYGHFVQEGRGSRSAGTGLCSYSLPEEPSLPITRVEAKAERLGTFLLEGKIVKITITAPDGRRLDLRSGQAAPLRIFPMPGMGCALNSGRPSWDCFAGFMKQSPRGLGGPGAWGRATIGVVANALDLESSPALTRTEALATSDTTALDALLNRHEGAAFANLDRLLADPTKLATVHHLAGLAERPGQLSQKADAMLIAMSAALAHGKGNSETARNVQRLIAALPESDFRRIAPALLQRIDEGRPIAAAKDRHSPKERIDGNLARRLGDIGAPALPLLERLAFTPRGESAASALLGLCRMNDPPSDLASRLTGYIVSNASPTSETRAAAYVTLVRWKRSDLAKQLLDDKGRNSRDYERRWPGLSESAGPEFCTFRMQQ